MTFATRRAFLAGGASLAGAAVLPSFAHAQSTWDPNEIYGASPDERFPLRAVDLRRIRPQFYRTVVPYDGGHSAGSIVIDPESHYLYFVQGDATAIRYGVGVGRDGFLWSGDAEIKAKREWPDWYPPKEMMARDPRVAREVTQLQSGLGMPGGPGNPLGARAMYLFQGNKDTLYRIHGTVEPWSIGHSVSSGCIRMINQDVFDLYNRVPLGTKVLVLGHAEPSQVAEHTMRTPDANDGSTFYNPDEAAPQPDLSGSTQPYGGYGNDPYATYAPEPGQGY